MKKKILKLIIIITFICLLPFTIAAKTEGNYVYLGGTALCFDVKIKGAYVLALNDVITEQGIFSPSKQAGVMCGDKIIKINSTEINGATDITKALNGYKEGVVVATIDRNGEIVLKDITPVKDLSGRVRLGVFVRDGLDGIGTLTFVKPDKTFMALGHPVCDEDGKISSVVGGRVYPCSIYGAVKGERGHAGELKGITLGEKPSGSVLKNTPQGITGVFNEDFDLTKLDRIEIGVGRMGDAQIYACVDGVTKTAYKIEIVKVDRNEKNNKN